MLTNNNPCIDKCCLNEEDICLGCFRTLEEILKWRSLSIKEKEILSLLLKERKNQLITAY